MAKIALAAFLVVMTFDSSFGQIFKWPGSACPKVETKADFKLTPYMGKWYEIEKYPNSFQSGGCGVAMYTLNGDATVTVNNTELVDGAGSTAIGSARADPGSEIPGHLQVRFSKFQPWGKYWVLDTDYSGYSVVYSCTNFYVTRVEFLWILSRSPHMDAAKHEAIYKMLQDYKIDIGALEKTDQDDDTCKPLRN